MLIATIAFLVGVFFAPVVRPLCRPILVEIIRAGLLVGDEVRRMTTQVREGLDDARAEAAASANRAEAPPPSSPAPEPKPSAPPAQ